MKMFLISEWQDIKGHNLNWVHQLEVRGSSRIKWGRPINLVWASTKETSKCTNRSSRIIANGGTRIRSSSQGTWMNAIKKEMIIVNLTKEISA